MCFGIWVQGLATHFSGLAWKTDERDKHVGIAVVNILCPPPNIFAYFPFVLDIPNPPEASRLNQGTIQGLVLG